MVRRWSRGKVSASLYNNGVNATADTHPNGDTLELGYTHTVTNCQTAVTWQSLGIPLQQWCEYYSGYTRNWGYSLTGFTLTVGTNCQTVVTRRSLGIPPQQWCEYDCGYTSKRGHSLTGDTHTLGTNCQTADTRQRVGIPLQQWCEYDSGYT